MAQKLHKATLMIIVFVENFSIAIIGEQIK